MRKRLQLFPFVLFSLALASSVRAQSLTSNQVTPADAQGQMHGWAVGLQIEDTASPSTPPELRIFGGGTTMPTAEPWTETRFGSSSVYHPDFSEAALGRWATSRNAPLPVYGGMSSGGDICPPVTASGELQMGSLWYSLSFTVASGAVGLDGSVVSHQRAGGRNHAADVFTYYAEGGTGLHPSLYDSVYLEYDRAQLGLGSDDFSLEVNSIDWGLGAISVDPEGDPEPTFPIRNRFYFSLSKQWIQTHGGTVQAASPSLGFVLDPGAVYCVTWQSDSLQWSDPVEVYSRATLFPGTEASSVEIDALSVYESRWQTSPPPSSVYRLVLSLTPESDQAHPPLVPPVSGMVPAYSQVLVYEHNVTQGAQEMKSAGGTPMVREMGLRERPSEGLGEPDDVTGTCGYDPDDFQLASRVAARSIYPGTAGVQGSGKFGLSGYRTVLPNAIGEIESRFFMIASGIDVALLGPYQFGAVKFFWETPTASLELSTELVVAGQSTCTFEIPGDLGSFGDVTVRAELHCLQSTSWILAGDSWNVTLDY